MSRRIVSILLSSLFLLFLTAPTIIFLVDDSVDVSAFYASSEEEEKASEKNKEIELLFLELNNSDLDFASSEVENNLGYYFKNYPKPHLNLISPPPECNIL
ncbi:hypothetical protein GCM10023314_05100 [Algibacter agarivorans]|uniref:Uncharacterized protein n=1 Tax=Algibacter agarivorans TaxID=1109741 RepID=A0ABP9GHP7_9FLAO